MKKHIPNAITCCNLISGCIAILFALQAQFELALLMIIVGAVFDFFDGMTARLLHVSSPIGKELDSLADVVTFGVAPSMMLYKMHALFCERLIVIPEEGFSHDFGDIIIQYAPYLAFLIAAFSALRLAKFNLDERQAMGFIGLPTPANALMWGSFIAYCPQFLLEETGFSFILTIATFISCYLLVSEIPMFALKFKTWGWKGNEIKFIFLITCLPLLFFFRGLGIAFVILWYMILSVATYLLHRE